MIAVDEAQPPKLYTVKEVTQWFPFSLTKIHRLFSDRKRHPDVYHSRKDNGIVIVGSQRTRKQKNYLGIPMSAIRREQAYGTSPAEPEPARRITPRRRKLKPRCKLYAGVSTIGRGKPASQSATA
jgi:hypothetical protein